VLKLRSKSILWLICCAFVIRADAFEVATHAAITNAAWHRLMSERSDLLNQLGLTDSTGDSPPLGSDYLDMQAAEVKPRQQFKFEANIIEQSPTIGLELTGRKRRVDGWLMSGAIREDDNPAEGNPKDDPYRSGGAFHREFNHFFDPYFQRPLSLPGIQTVYGAEPIRKAVDWALGTANAFADPNTRDTQSTWNHFTVFDAREAMFRALTLRRRNSIISYVDLPGTQNASQAEATRLAYWATTFRALGDMLHLNQDMAQPQHTRNEPHSGKMVLEYLGAGHESVFEKYMDERARQVPRILPGGAAVAPPMLPFDGYPTVAFEKFSDFWSTHQGPDSPRLGAGLADYSNSGFFTPAANYGDREYSTPPATNYPSENASGVLGSRPDVIVKFLRGDVLDRYTGSPSNIRMTTESVWDGRVTLDGTPLRTWNLNRLNYDDMASLLIPRAVAYSAGILEHFFRGEMTISLPDAGFYGIVDHAKFVPSQSGTTTDPYTGFKGFDQIRLKLKNATPRILGRSGSYIDQPMPRGALIAVLKFHRNTCYDDLLTRWPLTNAESWACRSRIEEIVTSDAIIDQAVPFETPTDPDGHEFAFHFPDRELPINAWDVVLQVVYRGQLGSEEDAVVVATRNIAEPLFAGFMNTTDYVVINGTFYTPGQVAANQALFGNVNPACRVGQPGGYIVSAACYNRIDAFTFTAGPRPVVIAGTGDTAVRPRRMARVALLTDRDDPPRLDWNVDAVSCWMFLESPLTLQPYPAELTVEQGWMYGFPNTVRSIRTWELHLCYADIGTQITLPDQLDVSQLDDMVGQELEPTALTIDGWQ
jgi:hypothetical protein